MPDHPREHWVTVVATIIDRIGFKELQAIIKEIDEARLAQLPPRAAAPRRADRASR